MGPLHIVEIALEPSKSGATVVKDPHPADPPPVLRAPLRRIRIRFDQPVDPKSVTPFAQAVDHGTPFSILVGPALGEKEADAQLSHLLPGTTPVNRWIAGDAHVAGDTVVWHPRPGGYHGDPFDEGQPYVLYLSGWTVRPGDRPGQAPRATPYPSNWPALRALRSRAGVPLDTGEGAAGGLFVLPFYNPGRSARTRLGSPRHWTRSYVVIDPLPSLPKLRRTIPGRPGGWLDSPVG
ncbi:MAG: hypothetical protein AAF602_15315 [Myxococcota bacterium]